MRIKDVTDRFAKLENRSGCYMRSRWNSETQSQTLTHKGSGNLIAEIYEFKNPENYRLRLHPYIRYDGRTSHNNRLHEVLRSIQYPDNNGNWEQFRYSTYIRYSLKVWDRKLSSEYELQRPMEFIYQDGRLTLDYQHFESLAFPEAPTTTPVALDENSNLQTLDNKLNAILAGV